MSSNTLSRYGNNIYTAGYNGCSPIKSHMTNMAAKVVPLTYLLTNTLAIHSDVSP